MSVHSVPSPQTTANMPAALLREVLAWTTDPTTAAVCKAWNRAMNDLYPQLIALYEQDPVFRSFANSYMDGRHFDSLPSAKEKVLYVAKRVREMAKPRHIRFGVKEIGPLDLPAAITGIEDANLCQVFQKVLPALLDYARTLNKLRASVTEFVTQAGKDSFNPIPVTLAQKALNIRTWIKQNKDLFAPVGPHFSLNLEKLDLSTLPPELCLLPEAIFLDLEHNTLTQLPSFFTRLTENITELYLSHNQLTHLPSDIGSLAVLDVFEVSHNHLSDLPASFSKLDQLQAINLSHNRFSDAHLRSLRERLPSITDHYEDNPDNFVLEPQDAPVEVARIEHPKKSRKAPENAAAKTK